MSIFLIVNDHSNDENKLIKTNQLEVNTGKYDKLTTKYKIDLEDNSKIVSCWLCTQQQRLMDRNKFKNQTKTQRKNNRCE